MSILEIKVSKFLWIWRHKLIYHGLNSSLTCDVYVLFWSAQFVDIEFECFRTYSSSLKSIISHYSTLVVHKFEHKLQSPVELVKTHIDGLIPSLWTASSVGPYNMHYLKFPLCCYAQYSIVNYRHYIVQQVSRTHSSFEDSF